MNISVIIPVHNGGEKFKICLQSVASAVSLPHEIIIAADGDSDGSWQFAEELGIKVIKLPIPKGPAAARNFGAKIANGDILFFTDADVTIPPDTIPQITAAFQANLELAAVIGSYDDEPYEANFLSQYKNLLHHHVHQNGNREAYTFWGACGAIRRDIFLEMGGFNETYKHPSIEDIELGYRLKKAGYSILLLKELQVKHLKRWTVSSLLKADFFYRALPWSLLILRDGKFINDLNINLSGRISVISVYMVLLSFIATFYSSYFCLPAVIFTIILFILNRNTYAFFKKKRGSCFAVKTIFWHWLYFFYSGLAFLIAFIRYRLLTDS